MRAPDTRALQRRCCLSSVERGHPVPVSGGIDAWTINATPRAAAITLSRLSTSPWSHSMVGPVRFQSLAHHASAITERQPMVGRLHPKTRWAALGLSVGGVAIMACGQTLAA
jgi:hypothetical protein